MTVRTHPLGADATPVLEVLASGGIVVIPTESSYGLAVDPSNPRAVESVFELKGRAVEKALPVVAASPADLPVRIRPGLEERLAALWPTAMTLILDLTQPLAAAAGGPTLAVRIPGHSGLVELLVQTGPLTATSANRSGQAPVLTAGDATSLLTAAGRPGIVVDGGELPGGPPSTLVRVTDEGFQVLRPGAVPEADLRAAARPSGNASSTAFVENSADE